MSPRERKGAVTLLYAVAMGLFLCVDWKIAVGMILFGWAMNVENNHAPGL